MAAASWELNGPYLTKSEMYRVKPYYDTEAMLDLPTCMYKMKSVYSLVGESCSQKAFNGAHVADGSRMVGVDELERRQEKILLRLEELKRQVQQLVGNQAHLQQTATKHLLQDSKTPLPMPPSSGVIQDLVISVDPRSPPLSLFVLAQMLAEQQRVLLSSYVHSSARNLVSHRHLNVFESNINIMPDRRSYHFGFTIIWKSDTHLPSLVVSPGSHVPIRGEATIARYLARLMTPPYDADLTTGTQVDVLLDLAALLLHTDASQTQGVLKSISAALAAAKWFMNGSQPTLADIVLWSAVKQRRHASVKVPNNLVQWLNECDQYVELASVVQLL